MPPALLRQTMASSVRPVPPQHFALGSGTTEPGPGAVKAFPEPYRDEPSAMRFVLERRTPGLLWSERLGCLLATLVALAPSILFCNTMLQTLENESGITLLLLSIAMLLGACVAIFLGIAISVFVWWIPRLAYLAMNSKIRRSGVRAGVRSEGIWIGGIGWLGWKGIRVREKSGRPSTGCAAVVIHSPQHGELVLHSPENAPELLRQIKLYMGLETAEYQQADFQSSEFPETELMPQLEMPRTASPAPEEHADSEFQATIIMSDDVLDLPQASGGKKKT